MTREDIARALEARMICCSLCVLNFAAEQVNKALDEAAQIAVKDCYYDVEAAIDKLKIKE